MSDTLSRPWRISLLALFAAILFTTTAVFGQSATPDGKQLALPANSEPLDSSGGGFINIAPRALIFDGSFENDPTSWTEWANPNICKSIGDWEAATEIPSFDGARYLWGGGFCNGIPVSNYAAQTVTLDPSQTILSFYYYTDRRSEDSVENDDFGYVSLAGQTIWELPLTQGNNSNQWESVQLSIADFANSTSELRLGAISGDLDGVGNIFFDFVEITSTELTIDISPDLQTISPGDDVSFTIELTNSGEVDLDEIKIAATIAACEADYDGLTVGETVSYSCDVEDVEDAFTNQVTATASAPFSIEVVAMDEAIVELSEPGLDLTISPNTQTVYAGGTAEFTVTVTNTGNEPLDNIVVSSATTPNCNTTITSLPANAAERIQCTRPGTLSDYENVVEATAVSSLGVELSAEDAATITVIEPSITISKTPDSQTRLIGETATFQVTVRNDGDTALTNLIITDSAVGDCDTNRSFLGANRSHTYECEEVNVQTSFNSEITVVADDVLGNEVTASDTAFVEVSNLNLRIFITPDEQTIVTGETANFSILVLNLSNVTLEDVEVDVPNLAACDNTNIGSLAPQGSNGDSVSYSCGATLTSPLTVEATVSATAGSSEVQDSAVAQVNVLALEVQLTSLLETVDEPGGDVEFTLRVLNSGNEPVTLTEISSLQLGNLDSSVVNEQISNNACTVGQTLEAGESYSCTYIGNVSGQPGNYLTTVMVTGEGEANQTVSANNSAQMTINNLPSSLMASTIATPASITAPEGNVSYEVTLTNLSVADEVTVNQISSSLIGALSNRGSCSLPLTLAPQETYRCRYTIMVQGQAGSQQVNALIVTGVDDDGEAVGAETAVSVQVTAPPVFNLMLPYVAFAQVYSEPNDNCSAAFSISSNINYAFLPDDVEDWYVVDVPTAGNVTIKLTNFIPQEGQLVVYKGASCGEATLVGNDGSFESTKQVALGQQTAGRFYIFVINDGSPSSTVTYNLTVELK